MDAVLFFYHESPLEKGEIKENLSSSAFHHA